MRQELLPSDTAELGLQDHVSKLSEALLCAEKMKIDRLARFKVVQEKTVSSPTSAQELATSIHDSIRCPGGTILYGMSCRGMQPL